MNSICTNYFDLHPSKAEAWEHCQDIYWLLVMLEDSGYSESIGCYYPLKHYACQIARDYWHLLSLDERQSIKELERYINKKEIVAAITVDTCLAASSKPIQVKEQIHYARKIVESIVDEDVDISYEQALGLTVKYALALGADERDLSEKLKRVIPNPYLIVPKLIDNNWWWQASPDRKNVIDLIGRWIERLIEPSRFQEKRDFDNFLNQCDSLKQAWETCPKAEWLLALIDLYTNYASTAEAQGKFRQFVCQITENDPYLVGNIDCSIAVEVAERFINGEADLKDLKLAEIAILEKSTRRLWRIEKKGLLCVHQSARQAVIEVARNNNWFDCDSLEEVFMLRKLMNNPFV